MLSSDSDRKAALRARKWTLIPRRADDGYDVDLHNDGIARWRSPLRPEVWLRARRLDRDGVAFQVLGPEDRLIYLCWTVIAEGVARRKAIDIARILQNAGELNWNFVAGESHRLGLALNVRLVCELTTSWYNLPQPECLPQLPVQLRWRHRLLLDLLRQVRKPLPTPYAQLVAILVYDHPLPVWLPAIGTFLLSFSRRFRRRQQ